MWVLLLWCGQLCVKLPFIVAGRGFSWKVEHQTTNQPSIIIQPANYSLSLSTHQPIDNTTYLTTQPASHPIIDSQSNKLPSYQAIDQTPYPPTHSAYQPIIPIVTCPLPPWLPTYQLTTTCNYHYTCLSAHLPSYIATYLAFQPSHLPTHWINLSMTLVYPPASLLCFLIILIIILIFIALNSSFRFACLISV